LAGLEVVTADEGVVTLGELDGTFEDAGYGEDS
jgi:hypothetical protein